MSDNTNPMDGTPQGQAAAGSEQSGSAGSVDPISQLLAEQNVPYQNLSDLATGYKHVQAAYTKSQQENKALADQVMQLQLQFQGLLQQQAAQPQTAKGYDIAKMNNEEIITALNEDAQGLLSSLIQAASQQNTPFVQEVQKLKEQQYELQLVAAAKDMEKQYAQADPNFRDNMQAAGKLLLEDPAFSNIPPHQGLFRAYQNVLTSKLMADPNILGQLLNPQAQTQQSDDAMKRAGAATVSSHTVNAVPQGQAQMSSAQRAVLGLRAAGGSQFLPR